MISSIAPADTTSPLGLCILPEASTHTWKSANPSTLLSVALWPVRWSIDLSQQTQTWSLCSRVDMEEEKLL